MKVTNIYRDVNTQETYLEWDDAPTATNYFTVYYNRTSNLSEWSTLGTTGNTFYLDIVNTRDTILFQELVYKITAHNQAGTVIDTVIVNNDPVMNKRPLYERTLNILRYQADIALRNSNWAFHSYIIKPKTTGVFCSCYQRDLRRSNNPQCDSCYGKGRVGGFYDPIPSTVKILTEQIKTKDINEFVPLSYDLLQVTIPTTVKVFNGDYLIIPDLGMRFVVTASNIDGVVSARTATQTCTISRLKNTDVFYSYPIADKVTTVSSVFTENGYTTVTGTNMFPIMGSIKLVLGNADGYDLGVYTSWDITALKDTEIVFRTDLYNISNYSYRFLINSTFYSGTGTGI